MSREPRKYKQGRPVKGTRLGNFYDALQSGKPVVLDGLSKQQRRDMAKALRDLWNVPLIRVADKTYQLERE